MSGLIELNTKLGRRRWSSLVTPNSLLFFVCCFLLGIGVVAWRTKVHYDARRAQALREAGICASALESKLRQVATAAEGLALLVKYSEGWAANFQKVAAELQAARPDLASLQIEPGGVVKDIFPRVGNERALGSSTLQIAGQRASAEQTITRRTLTFACPVTLWDGTPGLCARIPIFKRAIDGQESFWGFVAVNLRLQDVYDRSQLDDAFQRGYGYALLAVPQGQQTPLAITSRGLASVQSIVQRTVRAQNLEFRIALKPRGGWLEKSNAGFEVFAVLVVSAILAVSATTLQNQRQMHRQITEINQQLVDQTESRSKAVADCHAATQALTALQSELDQTRLALQEAQAKAAQSESRLEAEAQQNARQSGRYSAELNETRSALDQRERTIKELNLLLESAAESEKRKASALQEELREAQARTAELQKELAEARRSASEAAERNLSHVGSLEQDNRKMQERVQETEARISELLMRLSGSQQDPAEQPESSGTPAEIPDALQQSPGELQPEIPDQQPPPSIPDIQESAVTTIGNGSTSLGNIGVLTDPSVSEPVPAPLDQGGGNQQELDASETQTAGGPGRSPPEKVIRTGKRKKAQPDSQLSLFANGNSSPSAADEPIVISTSSDVSPEDSQDRVPARRVPAAPPVDPAQLRKAVSQIVLLLSERDPGAKDCLRDNRRTFRSAFTPEAYLEFEHQVKSAKFDAALDQLKKAARKHGISA